MTDIIRFFTSAKIMDLATDPTVLFITFVVFVVAVLMRWKYLLLVLFAVAGTLVVVRYTSPGTESGVLDQGMVFFVGGILVVAVVLIYFLFIKGD
jgi:hypothetical protein